MTEDKKLSERMRNWGIETGLEYPKIAADEVADLEKRLSESDYERNKYSSEYYSMLEYMEAMRDLIDAAEYVLDNRSDRHDHWETGETVEVVLADSLDDLAEAFRRLNREKLTAS